VRSKLNNMKNKLNFLIISTLLLFAAPTFSQKKYEPTWASIDARPVPDWFMNAKFGIFIHWGPYSVPAWAPVGTYSEWYQYWLQNRTCWGNNITDPEVIFKYHNQNYGRHYSYYQFGDDFRAELFNPDEWAKLFQDAGAKYIVLTSKHHDGFCLWPSAEANKTWGFPWNAVDCGPKRDLIGDLQKAVKKTDVKFGLYYSLYEWFNPLWLSDRDKFVAEHTLPQLKDLVNRYQSDIVWPDGDWDASDTTWRSREFLTWLFNESPVKDKVAVNDRWGKGIRHHHGGYFSPEYESAADRKRYWEECRGMGFSFGYNRQEDAMDYSSVQTLVLTLVDIVSHGGNLLLDIGPDASGKIPPIMQDRLLGIGAWLKTNGEAIYETEKWRSPVQWSEGQQMTAEQYKEKYNQKAYIGADFILKQTVSPEPGMAVKQVFFTRKGDALFAITPVLPKGKMVLKNVTADKGAQVTLLGYNGMPLAWTQQGKDLVVSVPTIGLGEMKEQVAYAFKVSAVK
jgi:alpha-L-fucosidase